MEIALEELFGLGLAAITQFGWIGFRVTQDKVECADICFCRQVIRVEAGMLGTDQLLYKIDMLGNILKPGIALFVEETAKAIGADHAPVSATASTTS